MTRAMHSSFHAVKDLHKPPKACVGHQDNKAWAWAAPLPGVHMADPHEVHTTGALRGPQKSFWEWGQQRQAEKAALVIDKVWVGEEPVVPCRQMGGPGAGRAWPRPHSGQMVLSCLLGEGASPS